MTVLLSYTKILVVKEFESFINSLDGMDQLEKKPNSFRTSPRSESFQDQLDIERASGEGMAQNNYKFEKEAAISKAQINQALLETPGRSRPAVYAKPGEIVYVHRN